MTSLWSNETELPFTAFVTLIHDTCPTNKTRRMGALRRRALATVTSRDLDFATIATLISIFAVCALVGGLGNALTCYVVARRPRMRTPLNLLIANLALSDVMLCVITQPFNVVRFSRLQWTLGDIMCKAVPLFAGINVFVSTITICVIALYRYMVIVHPGMWGGSNIGAAGTIGFSRQLRALYTLLATIWITALLLASPLLAVSHTVRLDLCPGVPLLHACMENAKMRKGRLALSFGVLIVQYVIPTTVIAVTNTSICRRLNRRPARRTQPGSTTDQSDIGESRRRSHRRKSQGQTYMQGQQRKTGALLLAVTLTFAVSWLPLNVFNVLADVNASFMLTTLNQSKLIFPLCHLLVLFSAALNPLLYGWLNTNFRDEFVRLLCPRRYVPHVGRYVRQSMTSPHQIAAMRRWTSTARCHIANKMALSRDRVLSIELTGLNAL